MKLMKSNKVVGNILMSEKRLSLATNGGEKLVDIVCNVPVFGGDQGWFSESALTNIHGLLEVVRNGHCVVFDSENHNGFIIKLKMGDVLTFTCNERGLYVRSVETPVDCSVYNLNTKLEGFTQREVHRARASHKFYHDLNAKFIPNMNAFIRSNQAKNVPIGTKAFALDEKIFGKEVPTCKGKWVRSKTCGPQFGYHRITKRIVR